MPQVSDNKARSELFATPSSEIALSEILKTKLNPKTTENGAPSPIFSVEDSGLPVKIPATASEAFSIILESVGSDGRWQWYLFFVSGFCGNFTALHNLGAGKLYLFFVPTNFLPVSYKFYSYPNIAPKYLYQNISMVLLHPITSHCCVLLLCKLL